jgi:CyaY protein
VDVDDKLFDQIADDELHRLEKALGDFDPDEVEADLASGVLTIRLPAGEQIVVNSHRAAGQIWMAARTAELRKAWHFSPQKEASGWSWRTDDDELHAALGRILGGKLGRPIQV